MQSRFPKINRSQSLEEVLVVILPLSAVPFLAEDLVEVVQVANFVILIQVLNVVAYSFIFNQRLSPLVLKYPIPISPFFENLIQNFPVTCFNIANIYEKASSESEKYY